MSIVSSGELQERFYVTKHYGQLSNRWPKSVICLVNCNVKKDAPQATWECITGTHSDFDDWERFDNSYESIRDEKGGKEKRKFHAEPYMIEALNTKIFEESDDCVYTDIKITIYINYSPCSDCAQKIIDMKKKLISHGIKVHNFQIVFANFYKCHGDTEDNKLNRNGLVNLLQNGVSLYVFSLTVWNDLIHTVLKVPPERILDHVIPDRKSRDIRESIDQTCLECLQEKSTSANHRPEHETILEQVFAKYEITPYRDVTGYKQFVTEKSLEYKQIIQGTNPLVNRLQSLNL